MALLATTFAGTPFAQAHTYVAGVVGATYVAVRTGNVMEVAYACAAAAAGDVASTEVTCGLGGALQQTIMTSGSAAVFAGAAALPAGPVTVCYTATFTYVDLHTKTVTGCSATGIVLPG